MKTILSILSTLALVIVIATPVSAEEIQCGEDNYQSSTGTDDFSSLAGISDWLLIPALPSCGFMYAYCLGRHGPFNDACIANCMCANDCGGYYGDEDETEHQFCARARRECRSSKARRADPERRPAAR